MVSMLISLSNRLTVEEHVRQQGGRGGRKMKILLRILAIVMISFVFFSCNRSSDSTVSTRPETGVAGDGRLDLIVDYIREQNGLPAIAAIMVHDGQIIEKSAIGKRSIAFDLQVTVDDQWHIGSCTKSMTSLVAALLVKEGVISWNSTIASVYPELVGVMRSEYQDVRLDELLSHTSGLPNQISAIPYYNSYYTDQRELRVQRQELVEKVLVLSSTATRGVYEYNNIGYIIAGAMLERVTGSSWETLMQTKLFNPLLMTRSGFGAPDTQGSLAQPLGHRSNGKGSLAQPLGHRSNGNSWLPVDPSDQTADNAPVLGPAGTVHVSLDDMAAYIGLHLKGLRGESVDGFLYSQEFEKLYTPFPNSDYALGWVVGDQFIWHNGSNSWWYAEMVVYAEKNTALFAVTNAADLSKGLNSKATNAIADLLGELGARADAAFQ
jgi:CubicO group peptidase (beta-lactamase class C family)